MAFKSIRHHPENENLINNLYRHFFSADYLEIVMFFRIKYFTGKNEKRTLRAETRDKIKTPSANEILIGKASPPELGMVIKSKIHL